jgi:N-acyl homoserine lactone hydrolase
MPSSAIPTAIWSRSWRSEHEKPYDVRPRCQTDAVIDLEVRRVDFGYFVRPGTETESGRPRVEPCLGYLVGGGDEWLLIDTGMGSHPEVDAHYRPRRHSLEDALSSAGAAVHDVRWVTNCHLHFDHCGGNPALAGRPIFVQRIELETAQGADDYTLPELVDAPGLVYEVLDGEAELMAGVLAIPTPSHTDGHQSIVVRQSDGTVIVAGQSHDSASAYAGDALGWRARHDGHVNDLSELPAWMDRLQRLDPSRVVFAHDHSVWEP